MNRSYSKIRHIQESNLRLEKRTLTEALGGGEYDASSIDKIKAKYPNGISLLTLSSTGNATFANGIDTINGQNPQIKNIVNTILAGCGYGTSGKCTRKVSATISGGASAVGNTQGYDNKALATRRRDNFIDYLKRIDAIAANPTLVSIIAGGTKVGVATVQNSPEAQKEQYVSAAISTQTTVPVKGVEGDNTNVANPDYTGRGPKPFDPTITPIKGGKTKRVCIKIPESLVDEFRLKVREFKQEQGLKDIPFGVYDIKK
jgi:hypothetical protein